MKIIITSAIGEGDTELSAFDTALLGAGIANTNLLTLSSVIPSSPEIIFSQPEIPESRFGDRLYVVLAQHRTSKPGKKVSAGIGWVIEKQQRFGLFVEHEADTKEEVAALITASLKDMTANRSSYEFLDVQMKVEEAVCVDKPVCALTCAVYKLENWE